MSDRTVVTIGRFKYPFAITLMTIAVLTVVGLFIYVYVLAESSAVEEEEEEDPGTGDPGGPWYEDKLSARGDGDETMSDYLSRGWQNTMDMEGFPHNGCGHFTKEVAAYQSYAIVHLQHVSGIPPLSSCATYTCAGDPSPTDDDLTNASTLAVGLNDNSTEVCVVSPVEIGGNSRVFAAATSYLYIGTDLTGHRQLEVLPTPILNTPPVTDRLCYKIVQEQDYLPDVWSTGQPVRSVEKGHPPGCDEPDYCPLEQPAQSSDCWWNRCSQADGISVGTKLYEGPPLTTCYEKRSGVNSLRSDLIDRGEICPNLDDFEDTSFPRFDFHEGGVDNDKPPTLSLGEVLTQIQGEGHTYIGPNGEGKGKFSYTMVRLMAFGTGGGPAAAVKGDDYPDYCLESDGKYIPDFNLTLSKCYLLGVAVGLKNLCVGTQNTYAIVVLADSEARVVSGFSQHLEHNTCYDAFLNDNERDCTSINVRNMCWQLYGWNPTLAGFGVEEQKTLAQDLACVYTRIDEADPNNDAKFTRAYSAPIVSPRTGVSKSSTNYYTDPLSDKLIGNGFGLYLLLVDVDFASVSGVLESSAVSTGCDGFAVKANVAAPSDFTCQPTEGPRVMMRCTQG